MKAGRAAGSRRTAISSCCSAVIRTRPRSSSRSPCGTATRSSPGTSTATLSRGARRSLASGEEKTTVFFLGEESSDGSLEYLLGNVCDQAGAKSSLAEAVSFWRTFPKLSFDLPDRSLSLLCNRFLPYQTVASRLYARAGYYQIGGAFGFRAQLQDVLALLW